MKKNEPVKTKPVKTKPVLEKQVKILFSKEHFALIAFAAATKNMRWGDYIRNIVVEQARKDFKEKEKIEGA